ncbi:MAG: ribonuclease R [Nitrospirota bacterium]
MVTKDIILKFFREKTKRPLGFKEVVSLMELSRSEAKALKRILRMMVRNGDLIQTRKGLYGHSEAMNLVNGYFEPHKDGYGFVIPEKPGERDIFIPPYSTMGAMDNDRVIVRIENWHKREGRIIRIIERVQSRIAGKFVVTRTGLYVKPKDKSLNIDLFISQKDRSEAKDGDIVIAEIISYPIDRKPPAGKVVKIIKRPEEPRAEVEAIIDEFNLPRRFPRNVIEEANSIAVHGSRAGFKTQKRKDLRLLPTVTIDGDCARDFDDAVSIKITEHGYKLYVHIADVGFYVKWDSAIDIEARKRGTSIYFPDRVIPMLPCELSEDLCSLKPKVERLAFTVEMDFGRNGNMLSAKFYPSVIISDERMTYTSVRKILVDNDPHERMRYDYLLHDLELMGELCGILRNKRLERGSLDFDLPEPEVLIDIQGMPEGILKSERNYAHVIIEEFMIAANEAVAEHLDNRGIPVLYRVHEEPDFSKFEDIGKFVKSIYKVNYPLKSKNFSELLRYIKGKPEEEIVNYMILRSLKQARYSHINVGHFGLASKCYTHFTSPIRRYPDLVVHRILREILNKRELSDKQIQKLKQFLPDIAFSSSRMERLAEKAETKVVDAMRVWFMRDKVGEEFKGRIVSVTPYGIKVRLEDFYIEGFIHVSYMTNDFYQYNERLMSLIGRHTRRSFTIGKKVTVRIDRVDMEERAIVMDLIG